MAKMGSRKHLKRLKAPKNWPIHQKENTWTVKPAPGPHAIEKSIPLMIVVRDILSIADNAREAKRIINSGDILVDGRKRKDYKFPVGFMDLLEIPKTGETYRVLIDKKGKLVFKVTEEKTETKLCKITDKTTIKGGLNQLNLHDGRNHVEDGDFSVSDVVLLNVPEQEIQETFKFTEGSTVLVTGGKHIGETGKIKEIIISKSSKPNTVLIETNKKDTFKTLKDYAFVVGNDKPCIDLEEA